MAKKKGGGCKQPLKASVKTLGCHGGVKSSGSKKKCADKAPAAQALGCHGGTKGGPARASKLSKARRKAIASMGAKAKGKGKKKRKAGGFFKQ